MYTWFYGFSDEPFNLNPDPQFLFLAKSHQQALELVIGGIKERKGFILISGDLGTGKTTLIQYLLNTLDKQMKAVAIFHPPDTLEELLDGILRELGVPPVSQSQASMVQQLNDYLHGLPPEETLTIIIDEAQDLSREVWEGLRLLGIPKKAQILFFGQPEFKVKVDSEDFRELKQRVEVIGQLQPLNEEECKLYISHRLNKVEGDINKVFTPEATSLICQHSKGNPRTINVLCDNAFLIGYGVSRKKVDSSIVTEVLEDLDFIREEEQDKEQPEEGLKFRPPARRIKGSLFRKISYSLLALAGVGAIIFWGRVFWKVPTEQVIPKFPIQPPAWKEKVALLPPEVKTGMPAQVVSKPEAGPKLPAPAAEPEGKPSRLLPPFERKPSAPAAEPRFKAAATKPMPAPQAPVSESQAERPIQQTVVVKGGDNIYSIALKTYQVANTSIVDYLLEFNPGISNPHKLLADQQIRLPEITEKSLMLPSSDGTYLVRLGTFLKPEYSTFLSGQPALQGRKMEIIPRKLPSGETWYRAMAGKFRTRDEALRAIQDLKGKGLSPYFRGFRQSK